jgi:YVTN family beta-propeller protein
MIARNFSRVQKTRVCILTVAGVMAIASMAGATGPPQAGASGMDRVDSSYHYLWVPNCDDNTVSVIDVTTRQVVRTIPVGRAPMHVSVGLEYVWVTHRDTPQVYRINRITQTVSDSIDVSATMAMPIGVAVDSLGFGYVVGRAHHTAPSTDQARAIKISPAGAILNAVDLPDVQGDSCDPSVVMGIGVNRSGTAFINWARSWNNANGVIVLDTQTFSRIDASFSPVKNGYLGPGIGIDREGNAWTMTTRLSTRMLLKINAEGQLNFTTMPCQVQHDRRDVAVNAWGDVWAGFEGTPSWLVSRQEDWGCHGNVPSDCGGLAFDPGGVLWVTFPSLDEVRSYDSAGNETGQAVAVGHHPMGYGDMTGSECGFLAPAQVGACCFGQVCQLLDPSTCANNNGTYQGDYQGCSPNLCETSSLPGRPVASVRLAAAAEPNPSAAPVRILYEVEGAGPVRIGLYDAGGRLIKSLTAAPAPGARRELWWDGTNDRGERVPAGIYLMRISARETSCSSRIVILR